MMDQATSDIVWKAKRFLKKTSSNPLAVIIVLIVASLAGFVFFSNSYYVDDIVIAEGEIISELAPSEVLAPAGGILIQLSVEIGSPVKKNQTLGLLRPKSGGALIALRSEIDGVISTLQASPRSTVQENQTLFTLVPHHTETSLRVHLPANRYIEVSKMDPIRVSIESYPYQKFGQFAGSIESIDQLTENRQPQSFSALAKVTSLPSQSDAKLLPGMKGKVFISVRKVSIFRLISEKILHAR